MAHDSVPRDTPILNLPGELRNLIYDFLLATEPAPKFVLWVNCYDPVKQVPLYAPRVQLHGPAHPPLAQTCRALRYEVLDTYYGLHNDKAAVDLHDYYGFRESLEYSFSDLPSHAAWQFVRAVDFTFTLQMERTGRSCVNRQVNGQVRIRATDAGMDAEMSLMGSHCCDRELEPLRSFVGDNAHSEETMRRAVSWIERAAFWEAPGNPRNLANWVMCESCGNMRAQEPLKKRAAKRRKNCAQRMWNLCREFRLY